MVQGIKRCHKSLPNSSSPARKKSSVKSCKGLVFYELFVTTIGKKG